MADENVVTEEVGVGTISGGGATGFDVGQFLLSSNNPVVSPVDALSATTPVVSKVDPVMLSDDVQVQAARSVPSLKTIATEVKKVDIPSSGAPNMDDLKVVNDVVANGACADADEISAATGLSKEVVMYCISWLVKEGLVAQDATRYCGLSAVKRMMEQLRGCKECFKI